MKYVNADDAVWKFSDSEFKRQMRIVSNGGEFDVGKGKKIAQGCTRLDHLDVDFAHEFLHPAPKKTDAECAAYIAELSDHYRESFARNEDDEETTS